MLETIATVAHNEIQRAASGRQYGFLRLQFAQPLPVLPGQFAMLKAHGSHEPLLRRAMAFYRAEAHDAGTSAEFIYQILGRGTQELAKLRAGAAVECLAALGNTYDVAAAQGREVLLVAGGVGSPALFMLAQQLRAAQQPLRLFIGGASAGDLIGLNDFAQLIAADKLHAATEDGSAGERGFVTLPLERHLRATPETPKLIYSCGPDPMLHRVAQIAAQYEVPAQLSLEAPMGCGFGVCVGCAVAVKHACAEGFVYKKVCTDGPVFWANELHF